jgi:hypothetical protein
MRSLTKGMVQVGSVTYRVGRIAAGQYEIVRLLDDSRIGTFSPGTGDPPICERPDSELVREIARLAMKQARTTWVPRA